MARRFGCAIAMAVVVLALGAPLRAATPPFDERLGTERDRMEGVGDGFHGRVVAGFRSLAAADPDRWVVLDGTGSVDDVAERVWTAVAPRIGVVDR